MDEKQIVDDIIHYLKLNNAGHIDRDNVFDVLVKYVENKESKEIDKLTNKIESMEVHMTEAKECLSNWV